MLEWVATAVEVDAENRLRCSEYCSYFRRISYKPSNAKCLLFDYRLNPAPGTTFFRLHSCVARKGVRYHEAVRKGDLDKGDKA